MNPVNATALYVSASRSVLQCDPRDPRALAELCKLLPFFRQSLSCLVCSNLLQDPIAPTDSSCQHYVCRGCKGQRMQLKPSCSWCKDYSRFEENQQLSLLVHCYKKLCLYIAQSPLAVHIAAAADDSPDLQAILDEGLALAESECPDVAEEAEDVSEAAGPSQECAASEAGRPGPEEVLLPPPLLSCVTIETGGGVLKQEAFGDELPMSGVAGLCDVTAFTEENTQKHEGGSLLLSVEESSLNGPHCPAGPDSSRLTPSIPQEEGPRPWKPLLIAEPKFPNATPHPPPHLAPVPNGGPPKVGKTVLVSTKGLKKTAEHLGVPKKAYSKARQGAPKPRTQPRDRVPPHPHPHAHPIAHPASPSKPLYKKPVEKKGCKCGRATQNPSVLTCRGQRCPCYSNRKACLDCICRGCQNSYMANGEKKLESFAVPEKALEQTRLTLGINLTSIAAATMRSPAPSAPSNTLINVTTATGAPVTAAFLSGAGHDSRSFDDSLDVRFDC
ncbi:hypothetical protein NHX12_021317 [Muraenolepis orangiensis]|uniref:E3 ubiquitin-protein ligase MSL2 n=1 Tax=Muraenolepis orangiensis TaxID=630683 RepID=A0A9Q0EQA5_9TELE|nr:hypothetical protein NHX12_021317 [Muraenolepis orangiensis]